MTAQSRSRRASPIQHAVFDLDGWLHGPALRTPVAVPALMIDASGLERASQAIIARTAHAVTVNLAGATHLDVTDLPCLVRGLGAAARLIRLGSIGRAGTTTTNAVVLRFLDTVLRRRLQGLSEQRNQRGQPFERESLVAEIPALHHLFEQFRAHQPLQNSLMISFRRGRFQSFLNPAPPLGVQDVHELRADRSAVNPPRFIRRLSRKLLKFWHALRLEISQRIESGFEIAPTPERVKHGFALLA